MLKTFYKHEQLTSLLREELRRDGFAGQRFHTVKYLKDTYQVSQATLTRRCSRCSGKDCFTVFPGKGHLFSSQRAVRRSIARERIRSSPYCAWCQIVKFSLNPTTV